MIVCLSLGDRQAIWARLAQRIDSVLKKGEKGGQRNFFMPRIARFERADLVLGDVSPMQFEQNEGVSN